MGVQLSSCSEMATPVETSSPFPAFASRHAGRISSNNISTRTFQRQTQGHRPHSLDLQVQSFLRSQCAQQQWGFQILPMKLIPIQKMIFSRGLLNCIRQTWKLTLIVTIIQRALQSLQSWEALGRSSSKFGRLQRLVVNGS